MTEPERAQRWRVGNNLTLAELAQLTGFSISAISRFEQGMFQNHGKAGFHKIPQAAWKRYKLVCAAVASGASKTFDW